MKLPKNLASFLPTTKFGKSIEGVHIMSDRIVATDAFKLIEVKCDTGAVEPYTVKLPKGLKTFENIVRDGEYADFHFNEGKYRSEIIEEEYPKYEEIVPKEKPVFEIKLNPTYLKDICMAFEKNKNKPFNEVKLSFYGKNKIVVFSEKEEVVRAFLMPIMSND